MKRDFAKVVAHTQKWEGGYVNDPDDNGGETNKGITYETWCSVFGTAQKDRFKQMSDADWLKIYMRYYSSVGGQLVDSDSVSFFMTQMSWGSGPGNAIKITRRALNLIRKNKIPVTGLVTPELMTMINAIPQRELFDAMVTERVAFFQYITTPENGKTAEQKEQYRRNQKFIKGWLKRLEDFRVTFRPPVPKTGNS